MNLGDIYYWITDKAIGHDSRPKYHIYICAPDWVDDHTFLFINKARNVDDFRITKTEYPFLTFPESYISCSGVVSYTDTELATFDPKLIGQLSEEHLRALFNAIAGSRTMERAQIKRLCNALQKAF